MKSIEIAIKNKTNLTLQLEKLYEVTYYEKETFFSKLIFQKKSTPDIYFHQGIFSKDAISTAKKSKLVIVNTQSTKNDFIQIAPEVNADKIEVVSPYFIAQTEYNKQIKKSFKQRYNIDKKSKIIFFRAKDLIKNGLETVFDILSRMYEENFTLIIESSSKQIVPLRIQLERAEIKYPYILFEDKKNIEELFIASDIFILPTSYKYFAVDVLKAMHYKNAVFIMEENAASEIVDVFSYIQGANDKSISFKVDSLLINEDELKKIQKQNKKVSKKYNIERSLAETSHLIEKYFDN
jgi:hypothetical protein